MGNQVKLSRKNKQIATRLEIQKQAFNLFDARGYDKTTVAQIAAAARISHMTFFRYFSSKKDVVVGDYTGIFRQVLGKLPAEGNIIDRIEHVTMQVMPPLYESHKEALLKALHLSLEVPELRARSYEVQQAIADDALRVLDVAEVDKNYFETYCIITACIASISAAALYWAKNEARIPISFLLERAFLALRQQKL